MRLQRYGARMSRLSALAAAIVIAGTPWWLTPSTLPGPPRGAAHHEPPAARPSTLFAEISLPWSVLAEGLSARIPETFADVQGQRSHGMLLDLTATRAGEVKVSGRDDHLVLEVPVDVSASAVPERALERRRSRGRDAPEGARVQASLTLEVAVGLTFRDDWGWEPEVRLTHRWTGRPTLSVGLLRVGLAKLADRLLEERFTEVAASLEQRLREETQLRDRVDDAWRRLHQPTPIARSTWLVTEPSALYASDPVYAEEGLELALGVGGTFELTVGPEPGVHPATALPSPTPVPEDPHLELALSTTLAWDTLAEEASGALRDADLPVRVTSVELYPSGEAVVAHLALSESLTGLSDLYLQGVPRLDVGHQEVRFDAFEYSFGAAPVWSAADLAVHDAVRAALTDRLRFAFGPQLETARARTERRLNDRPGIDASLDTLRIDAVHVTDRGLAIDAFARGRLGLTVAQLPERAPDAKRPSLSDPSRRARHSSAGPAPKK
ncbi:MAG: DUF4403 family protein [Deltaproteobacteria bacterium]|nr:MAG: DUF4403 family protein [Deltaproteobacteria bacterium]